MLSWSPFPTMESSHKFKLYSKCIVKALESHERAEAEYWEAKFALAQTTKSQAGRFRASKMPLEESKVSPPSLLARLEVEIL